MPFRRKPIFPAAGFALLTGLASATLVAAQPAAPPLAVPPQEAAPKSTEVTMPPASAATLPAPDTVAPAAPVAAAPAAPPKPVAPARRARYDVAVIEALDKVTAESLRFEAAVGRPVRYKSLVFTVKACERSAPDEAVDDSIAYLTIDSQPRPEPGMPALAPRQAFKGWMYASSPGLHPLEHPVYDAWLITCRAAAPVNPSVVSPAPAPAPPAR
ncbi:DUF2155 domain-containing protein [Phenylobacterium sp.]|uniref:DUF2155 domain-containing protein n=1 Tax=Phenylobacterium sp. TaxID=1871053 RepID=UPI001222319B|nr:DUF2155 domain-containing protein [Phenylobacterium sp.]THD65056.1 MAG: DUF2155 domain-containing protein [Phenylobacterium sp.]